jgi:hypothetical protein
MTSEHTAELPGGVGVLTTPYRLSIAEEHGSHDGKGNNLSSRKRARKGLYQPSIMPALCGAQEPPSGVSFRGGLGLEPLATPQEPAATRANQASGSRPGADGQCRGVLADGGRGGICPSGGLGSPRRLCPCVELGCKGGGRVGIMAREHGRQWRKGAGIGSAEAVSCSESSLRGEKIPLPLVHPIDRFAL